MAWHRTVMVGLESWEHMLWDVTPVVELLAAAPHCPQAQFILQGKRNLLERIGNGDAFDVHNESIPGCMRKPRRGSGDALGGNVPCG